MNSGTGIVYRRFLIQYARPTAREVAERSAAGPAL